MLLEVILTAAGAVVAEGRVRRRRDAVKPVAVRSDEMGGGAMWLLLVLAAAASAGASPWQENVRPKMYVQLGESTNGNISCGLFKLCLDVNNFEKNVMSSFHATPACIYILIRATFTENNHV